jgi:hypothetical protein
LEFGKKGLPSPFDPYNSCHRSEYISPPSLRLPPLFHLPLADNKDNAWIFLATLAGFTFPAFFLPAPPLKNKEEYSSLEPCSRKHLLALSLS